MNVWDSDIDVSPEVAALRIARQFPALAPVTVEPFGEGWDNVAYCVNGTLIFRFPRRRMAIPLLENEARVLPHLAALLRVSVPDLRYQGVPDDLYPTPFVGYTLLTGTTACRVTWTDDERTRLAIPMANALRELHSIPTDADWAVDAPFDTIRRAEVGYRTPQLRERLATLSPMLKSAALVAMQAMIDQLADTPLYDSEPRWVHGDLYARHLLVDADRNLCGLIDWGDLHKGDPALDLSIAFSFLPPTGEARMIFRKTYGEIDAATWDRARFRGLHYGAILALYGEDTGDTAIRDAGFYALHAAMKG